MSGGEENFAEPLESKQVNFAGNALKPFRKQASFLIAVITDSGLIAKCKCSVLFYFKLSLCTIIFCRRLRSFSLTRCLLITSSQDTAFISSSFYINKPLYRVSRN